MIRNVGHIGMALAKRAVLSSGDDDTPHIELPVWAWAVILAVCLGFIPVFIVLSYTFGQILPTLASIEDPSPPAYDPVSLNADTESIVEDDAAPLSHGSAMPPRAITSSLRATTRLLYSVGGWRSYFRGFGCALAIGFATFPISSFISSFKFIPQFVSLLLVSLCLVQPSAAWVHIVISQPHSAPFWRRLPPLRKTFEATCFPTLVVVGSLSLTGELVVLFAQAIGVPHLDKTSSIDAHTSWKLLLLTLFTIALFIFLVIPACVVLTRVQASLLPPDEDTIVPFDRSFEGKLEPAIVGGKGYVGMKLALTTVSRATWIRIYVLYAKLFALGTFMELLAIAILLPVIVLSAKKID